MAHTGRLTQLLLFDYKNSFWNFGACCLLPHVCFLPTSALIGTLHLYVTRNKLCWQWAPLSPVGSGHSCWCRLAQMWGGMRQRLASRGATRWPGDTVSCTELHDVPQPALTSQSTLSCCPVLYFCCLPLSWFCCSDSAGHSVSNPELNWVPSCFSREGQGGPVFLLTLVLCSLFCEELVFVSLPKRYKVSQSHRSSQWN